MLTISILTFLILALILLFVELIYRDNRWRIAGFCTLTLIVIGNLIIHYNSLTSVASADRFEVRGQYFPMKSTIRISGDPAEADYYTPALLVRGDDEEISENPLITLRDYDESSSTLKASLKGTARPLRLNLETKNITPLSGSNDLIDIGSLQVIFENGWLSRSKFIVNGKSYSFSWPRVGGVLSVGEALCQVGFGRAEQYQSVYASNTTDNGQGNSTQLLSENPLDRLWLVRDSWGSIGLVNGSNVDVKVNGYLLPAEINFTVKDGDRLTYGTGRRNAFDIEVKINTTDHRIYINPKKPLTYPLYISPDSAQEAVTQVTVSSAPSVGPQAYQLSFGERNRGTVIGNIQYSLNPGAILQANVSRHISDEEKTRQQQLYREGFVINSGLDLRTYKFGETATLGSSRGGALISLNRKQANWRPLFDVILLLLVSVFFFWERGWITRRNYLFILLPVVYMLLAVRLILAYRGYLLPPNLSDSYEKGLFALVFVPYAIFLGLYMQEISNVLASSNRYFFSHEKWAALRNNLLEMLRLPPFWYMVISCLLLLYVGAVLDNYAGVLLLIIFTILVLLITRFISDRVSLSYDEHPLLAWLDQGVQSPEGSGRNFLTKFLNKNFERFLNLFFRRPVWDIWFLFAFPLLVAFVLRVSGMRTEEIPYTGLRAELLYLPCLLLGSCRFYMWFYNKYFGATAREIRLWHIGWLMLPTLAYGALALIIVDSGFLIYALPVIILAVIVTWRASRWVSFAMVALLGLSVFLVLKTSIFTHSVAAMLPDSAIEYRYLAYQDPGYLQEAVLEKTADQSQLCVSSSDAARRIFGINEHFWTMFHFAARGAGGRGYGVSPIERVPFANGIAQSDNTYSIYIMSEHGSRGGIAVLALYLSLSLLLVFILTQHMADDPLPTLLVGGVALTILISALYHAAGNVGGVPFTGKNLPLLGLNSLADVLLVGILLALAFSVIGYGQKDLPAAQVGVLGAFKRNNALNLWLLFISLLLSLSFGVVVWQTIKASNNKAYQGDYNLDRFMQFAREQIAQGNITLDPNTSQIPPPSNVPGLGEGQYLRLLVDQFNHATPEEKQSGKYFFRARNLTLDEDLYGSTSPRDRYSETVLDIDPNHFKRPSPFADRVAWRGGILSRDAAGDEQDYLIGEGLNLFLTHVIDSDNPIPGVNDKSEVLLPEHSQAAPLAEQSFSRYFRLVRTASKDADPLFDLYAIERDAVLEPHATQVYVNGQPVKDKTRLEPGDIIALKASPATGNRDLVFSYQKGHSGQFTQYHWVNGREEYSYPMGETLSLARPLVEAVNTEVTQLEQNNQNAEAKQLSSTPLTLSLSAALNRKIYQALSQEGEDLWQGINKKNGLKPRLAVTAMNPDTGEVLALASWPSIDPNPRSAEQEKSDPHSYTNLARRRNAESARLLPNHNFTLHVLGSATKPFIASAAASAYPELLSLKVNHERESYEEVLGIPTKPAWKADGSGLIDWNTFLRRSDNYYAVHIGFLGLTKPGANGELLLTGPVISQSYEVNNQKYNRQPDFGGRATKGSKEMLGLEYSPLARKLGELFEIQYSGPDADPIASVWQQAQQAHLLSTGGSAINSISPEMPNLKLNNIRDARDFVMICLGGKTNLWSNVKSAEAFSRLLTGRRVNATMMKVSSGNTARFDTLDTSYARVRPALLKALEEVALTGTSDILASKIRSINAARGGNDGRRFAVFAKTGTLKGLSNRNDSNFIFAAGLWNENTMQLDDSIVLSIYIEKGDSGEASGRSAAFALKLMSLLDKEFNWSRATTRPSSAAR